MDENRLSSTDNSRGLLIARTLLENQKYGCLATHSLSLEGFPFASLVPYILDEEGKPIILVSRLAEHTKNIAVRPQVSLLVTEEVFSSVDQNRQALSRLSLACLVEPLLEASLQDISERYYHVFPEMQNFHRTLDFSFFQLVPQKALLVQGFGRVQWVHFE
jgi:heme iron utilization protein